MLEDSRIDDAAGHRLRCRLELLAQGVYPTGVACHGGLHAETEIETSLAQRPQGGVCGHRVHRCQSICAHAVACRQFRRANQTHRVGVVVAGSQQQWLSQGFGVAKIGGPPVTPRTTFQSASISKPVTALAVLRLAQSGKVNVDADVNGYLTSWKLPANEWTAQQPVTLRRRLTHSAGVVVSGFPGYEAGKRVPTLVQILNGVAPSNTAPVRVKAIPGKEWKYSGGGYVVVQQLLECDHDQRQ